jgi:hypothetical protein
MTVFGVRPPTAHACMQAAKVLAKLIGGNDGCMHISEKLRDAARLVIREVLTRCSIPEHRKIVTPLVVTAASLLSQNCGAYTDQGFQHPWTDHIPDEEMLDLEGTPSSHPPLPLPCLPNA